MKRYHDMGGDDTDNEVEEIVSEEVRETFHKSRRHIVKDLMGTELFLGGQYLGCIFTVIDENFT